MLKRAAAAPNPAANLTLDANGTLDRELSGLAAALGRVRRELQTLYQVVSGLVKSATCSALYEDDREEVYPRVSFNTTGKAAKSKSHHRAHSL